MSLERQHRVFPDAVELSTDVFALASSSQVLSWEAAISHGSRAGAGREAPRLSVPKKPRDLQRAPLGISGSREGRRRLTRGGRSLECSSLPKSDSLTAPEARRDDRANVSC